MKTVLVHDRVVPLSEDAASESPDPAVPAERELPQLRLGAIAAVWAAAALPMALLAWVIAPAIADHLSGPSALSRALIVTLTAGLVWQFVRFWAWFGASRHAALVRPARRALAPRPARSRYREARRPRLARPAALVVLFAAEELVPVVSHPASRDLADFVGSHAGHRFLAGSWGWFAILAALFLLNTVLGEELLFRGYLLPRMKGLFGRRDWLANGGLFAVYHLHEPWVIPGAAADPRRGVWQQALPQRARRDRGAQRPERLLPRVRAPSGAQRLIGDRRSSAAASRAQKQWLFRSVGLMLSDGVKKVPDRRRADSLCRLSARRA